VEHVRERLFELLNVRPDSIQLVVFSLAAVPKLDLAGAELLADLHKTLRARGIDLKLAHTNGDVRDALRRIAFERQHGPLETGQTVDVVISGWQAATAPTAPNASAG
jgi:MFS superfamily sulfate permease-like transporter